MKLFKPMVSVSGKLTVKPAYKLLRSYRVSLAAVEFPVGAFFIQRFSVDDTADIGNYAVGSYRLPIFSRGLFAGSYTFASLS